MAPGTASNPLLNSKAPQRSVPIGCRRLDQFQQRAGHPPDPARPALLESYYPYKPVGIVHLAAQKTMRFDPSVTVPLTGTDGRIWQCNLCSVDSFEVVYFGSALTLPL